jgi:hypothetical protein
MVNARRLCFPVLLFAVLLGGGISCGKSSTAPTGRATLSGIITDSSTGAAVAAVTVAVEGKSVTTGSDGRYSLADLPLGRFTVTLKHQGYDNVSQTVTLTEGSNQVSLTMTPALAARFQGTWSGSWVTSDLTTGSASLVVKVDTVEETFQATFDLNGTPYKSTDPRAEDFAGPYTTAGVTLTKRRTYYGDVTFTFAADGRITGSVVRPVADFPNENVASVTLTGTTTDQKKMAIRVRVVFSDGDPDGTIDITLNKS